MENQINDGFPDNSEHAENHNNLGYPVRTERQRTARYHRDNWSDPNDETVEHQILRSLEDVIQNQTMILARIDELEHHDQQQQQKLTKLNMEMQKVSYRTGYMKSVVTNTAAHMLNVSRRIHGANSVLDPVKDFLAGGYKDWSIRPVQTSQFSNNMQGFYNPFAQFDQNAYNWQQANHTPLYTPRTPAFEADAAFNSANRTPVYENANRTPSHHPRTPVYDDAGTNYGSNRTHRYDDRYGTSQASTGDRPGYSGLGRQSAMQPETSNMNRSGNRLSARAARFEPYQNRPNNHGAFGNSSTSSSPYVPSSPRYD